MSQQSAPSKAVLGVRVSPRRRPARSGLVRAFGRLLKLAGVGAILFLGAHAIISEQGYIASSNAVVSSQITVLRAPIEGYVVSNRISAGQAVNRDAVLQRIEQSGQRETALADLESDLRRLEHQREAAIRQRATLDRLLTTLEARANVGNAAQVARISATVESDRERVAAAETRRDQAKRDHERKLTLSRSGNAPQAEVDRLRSEFVAATQEVAATAATTQAEVAARDAALDGVLAEPGSNDVTYSMQRADEIQILLTHVDRSIADLTAGADQIETKLRVRREREEAGRVANVTAPLAGMVWKLGITNGERVSPGDMIMELVDCSNAFVMVSIPHYRMSEIAVGAEARFKLVGDYTERVARVVSIASDTLIEGTERFAAKPLPDKEPAAIVTLSSLSMPSTASECPMGRTARVLLPVKQGGLIQVLARRLGLDQIWGRLA